MGNPQSARFHQPWQRALGETTERKEATVALSDASGSPRNARWLIAWLVGSGCLLTVVVLGIVAAVLLQRGGEDDRLGGGVGGWRQAAAQVEMPLYRPAYLPPGAGDPRIRVVRPVEQVEEVIARYPGGLSLEQSNQQTVLPRPGEGEARVAGAETAYFATFAQRTLVVRKPGAWINISGLPDAELIRVAESLRPVER